MPFTVEDFHDLVRLLDERPQWRAEMRRVVLSDEYLAVPEQIAELRREVAELRRDTERNFDRVHGRLDRLTGDVEQLKGDVEQLKGDVEQLKGDVEQLKGDVGQLKGDVGQLKGENLERRYRERAHAYFGRLIRKVHVLTPEELSALLDDAEDRGVLSESDRHAVAWADLIVSGRWRAADRSVMVLAEISSVVDRSDVRRAADRAAALAKLGTPVVPVVAGASVTERAADLARSRNVWQMLDGRIVEPAGDAPM